MRVNDKNLGCLMNIIEVNNLSKYISTEESNSNLTILHGISFNVTKGQSLSILGRSGSGKTTLLNILSGLDIASEGEVKVLDHDWKKISEEERSSIRLKEIGFVFQSFNLISTLSAAENIGLPLELRQEYDIENTVQTMLRAVGLENRADHLPSQLSGGEQQRVALARSFITKPKILFADEPTGNLDQENSKKIINLMLNLNKKHETTLVIVTHDSILAERCDKVFTIG